MIAIEHLIDTYHPTTIEQTKSAIREIIQSIILVGLSRTNFFEVASFYGGTALRIFYGLNRYSEDLDFTLNETNENFSLEPYIGKIREVALSYGIEIDVTVKTKKAKTPIESAFAKLNTYQAFVNLNVNDELAKVLHKDEQIKVKFEVDCNPALGFNTTNRWIDLPEYAPIVVLDDASLFAGKLHAILCRNYQNNVKGRDYYDFLFYVSKRIKPNLAYLKNKLVESNVIKEDEQFSMDILKEMLISRINCVDFDQVKQDASRFVLENEVLDYYSKDLFIQMIQRM